MKKILRLFFLLNFVLVWAQSDSIKIHFSYSGEDSLVEVDQTFDVAPNTAYDEYILYAWANAYKDKNTTLAKTKLAMRKDQLYFAPLSERGWIEDLRFTDENNKRIAHTFINNEMIKLIIPKNKKRLKFKASYALHLPNKKITNYGIGDDRNILLKYFFLQPGVAVDDYVSLQHFKDFESLTGNHTHYELTTDIPDNYNVYTDLKEIKPKHFVGDKIDFFQLAVIASGKTQTIKTDYGEVIFGFEMDSADVSILNPIISEELAFLENTLGALKEPLFISKKSYSRHRFDGVQDVKIPLIGTYKIFDADTRLHLEMIGQLASAYADKNIIVDMRNDHWIRNGIKSYLQMKFIQQKYPDLLLSGKISDDIRLFNIRPLKMFEASKVKMTERSKIFYQLFLTANLDQAIDTPYDELSNLNQKNVSYYKTGLAFENFSAYLGEDTFHSILKKIIEDHCCEPITAESFKQYFEKYSNKEVDWFFEDFIPNKRNMDFSIQSAKAKGDSTLVKIKNKTELNVPFKISGYKDGVKTYDDWGWTTEKYFELKLPDNDYDLIVLNDSISFPDFNLKNNFYRPRKIFRRPLKFGLITDYPSYGHNQIFLLPEVSWNNYDKFQLGISATNKTILPQIWTYSVKPQYSVGENAFTGALSTDYNIYPNQGWFRRIKLSAGASYQHYNKGLAYKSYGLGSSFSFNKNPRSLVNKSISMEYQHIDREMPLDATLEQLDLKDYKLYNVGYHYWNPDVIHERRALVNFQISNSFSKIYGEFYWRWKFAENKRLAVRVFGGSFINHNLENSDYFDFGLDRITDYTFDYPLLGRSETSGLLSQQFVLAEGGFKSNFYVQADQYMYTMNLEYPIWKIFDFYGDLGLYKNKLQPSKFVYDSGFRVRVVPDFLEIYLPLQSSLGFEPTLGAYHERIRFMLNLDISKVISYWRRGKY